MLTYWLLLYDSFLKRSCWCTHLTHHFSVMSHTTGPCCPAYQQLTGIWSGAVFNDRNTTFSVLWKLTETVPSASPSIIQTFKCFLIHVTYWSSECNLSPRGPQWSNPSTQNSWPLALTPYPLIASPTFLVWVFFPPLFACFLCSFFLSSVWLTPFISLTCLLCWILFRWSSRLFSDLLQWISSRWLKLWPASFSMS